MIAFYPMVAGISFLEKVPPKFECIQHSSPKMESQESFYHTSWKKCTAEEICAEKLGKSKFRPVVTEQEFIRNWVEKLDLLCKPQSEIGFLGSIYFIGVLSAMVVIPKYADVHGRYKPIFFSVAL